MSAKSPEVVDGMIDDTLLGILVILLVVMLSTGYVYVQQLRQGNATPRDTAANRNLARTAPSTAAGLASVPERAAISTVHLNERQLRLHASLPMCNGARCVTISGDALFKTENPEALAWTNDEVPALLLDLSHVADVYLLCMVNDANDTQRMQQIRDFVATHPVLKGHDLASGGMKTHRILFCTTTIGKIAFVRQIEPQIHVEVDSGVTSELERHVPRIVHVPISSEHAATPSIPNVIHVGDSFSGYFSLISAKERA